MLRSLVCIAAVVALSACASTLPQRIREPVVGAPTFVAVQADPDAYRDHMVRWGGTIIEVRNTAADTVIEVLGKDLGAQGRPAYGDASHGRFLARFEGFLDPAVYDTGRQLTVYGRVVGGQEGLIGERPYLYPVVAVEVSHLWREDLYANVYPYDYAYGPWPFAYRRSLFFRYPFQYGRPYYW